MDSCWIPLKSGLPWGAFKRFKGWIWRSENHTSQFGYQSGVNIAVDSMTCKGNKRT